MPSLYRATQRQVPVTWKLNSAEWSEGLGESIHVQREQAQVATFSTAKHTRRAHSSTFASTDAHPGQINWVLLEHEDSDDILAACETLYRPALLSLPVATSTSSDFDSVSGVKDKSGFVSNENMQRDVKEGTAYGIASVYCRPDYRRKGYASLMMQLLARKLAEMECLGSALWSDIGPDFYERFGWATYPSKSLVLHVEATRNGPVKGSGTDLVLLAESELEAWCESDCRRMRDEMKECCAARPVFSFLPTYDTIRWHHARAAFMLKVHSEEWGLPDAETFNKSLGISLSDHSFAIWNMQFSTKSPVLYILRMRYADTQELQVIMEAAWTVAKQFKLKSVEVWDTKLESFETLATNLAHLGRLEEVEMRDSSISALQLNEFSAGAVEWLHNEKFCWC